MRRCVCVRVFCIHQPQNIMSSFPTTNHCLHPPHILKYESRSRLSFIVYASIYFQFIWFKWMKRNWNRQRVCFLPAAGAHMPCVNIWSKHASFQRKSLSRSLIITDGEQERILTKFTLCLHRSILSKFGERVSGSGNNNTFAVATVRLCVWWRDHSIHRHRHTVQSSRSACLPRV